MISPYRLAYLGLALTLMGGFAWVSAEMGPDDRAPNFGSLSKLLDAESGGVEKGNLSEVGAVELTSVREFQLAGAASQIAPVIIFKHSTECEISGAAYRRMAAWMKAKGEEAPRVFLVKVIEQRPVSQEIASRTAIKHESPQAIILNRLRPAWSASHEAITADALDAALAELNTGKHTD
jgi:bacillithiol system protein YtxJ